MDLYIFDSDGNPVGDRCDNMEDAMRRASILVCDTWQDWERATISYVPPSHFTDEGPQPVVTVERDGPRGAKRVKVLLAGAGWVRFTFGEQ